MSAVSEAINRIREKQGSRLLILGHHYQRSSVLRHADVTGDSLELSRNAGRHPDARRIVFCGVRFMAESADLLTGADQVVYMPDMSAGCPMAAMATGDQVRVARRLLAMHGDDWLPVVYVNSTADVKAACGEWGGCTCTSSNAERIFRWVFEQEKRILFLPDEHLGMNTARDVGLKDADVAVYDPWQGNGGLSAATLSRVKVLVWKGFCLVHQFFTPNHVKEARERYPGARVIVHPEAPREVVRAADAHGSTSQIISYVRGVPDGSTVIVGTEQNLVERLADEQRGRVVVKVLAPAVCANMARTNENNLLSVLEHWPTTNEVHVPAGQARFARKALERMLSL
jgi:quinolinate synthase